MRTRWACVLALASVAACGHSTDTRSSLVARPVAEVSALLQAGGVDCTLEDDGGSEIQNGTNLIHSLAYACTVGNYRVRFETWVTEADYVAALALAKQATETIKGPGSAEAVYVDGGRQGHWVVYDVPADGSINAQVTDSERALLNKIASALGGKVTSGYL
jgi:hypothetical protein